MPESTRATEEPGESPRLLVITYYFPPHESVGGLRWAGISKYLAQLGWKVAVMAGASPAVTDLPGIAQMESCSRLWTVADACRLLKRVAVGRSSQPSSNGSRPSGGLAKEVLALLTYPDESRGWIVRAALRTRSLIRRFHPQVVISSGPPHSAHLVAALATVGKSARWLVDLRDPWADPLGKAWEYHPRLGARIHHVISPQLERFTCRAADGIITNTKHLAEVISARYSSVPVACIPNGVDAQGLPAVARDRYPGLSIAYAGTLYGGRDLGSVVRALGIFLKQFPDAVRAGSKLRIAGEVEAHHGQALNTVVAETGVGQQVEMRGRLSRSEALEVVSRSRLAVVLAQGQELQVPAKLYESVGMGIPTLVLAERTSAAAREGERVGAVIRDPGDVQGIVEVMQQVWRSETAGDSRCPVPVTYQAMAPAVDRLLRLGFGPALSG